MDTEMLSLDGPLSSNAMSDFDDNSQIGGDNVKECPLCKSEVRLFFINFNEKMLMCENADCDYPYGYVDNPFVKQDIEIQSDEEVASIKTAQSQTMRSCVSTRAWSEIDKIIRVCNDDTQFGKSMDVAEYLDSHRNKSKKKVLKDKEIMENLEYIKELNTKLKETEETDEKPSITNEKWIKHLFDLQGMTSVQLLQPEEMKRVKTTPSIAAGELKIDINRTNSISLINVKITNNDEEMTNDESKIINGGQETTNDSSDIITNKSEITNDPGEITNEGYEIINSNSEIINNRSEVTNNGCEISNDKSQITDYGSERTNDMPKIMNGSDIINDKNEASDVCDTNTNEFSLITSEEFEFRGFEMINDDVEHLNIDNL